MLGQARVPVSRGHCAGTAGGKWLPEAGWCCPCARGGGQLTSTTAVTVQGKGERPCTHRPLLRMRLSRKSGVWAPHPIELPSCGWCGVLPLCLFSSGINVHWGIHKSRLITSSRAVRSLVPAPRGGFRHVVPKRKAVPNGEEPPSGLILSSGHLIWVTGSATCIQGNVPAHPNGMASERKSAG